MKNKRYNLPSSSKLMMYNIPLIVPAKTACFEISKTFVLSSAVCMYVCVGGGGAVFSFLKKGRLKMRT